MKNYNKRAIITGKNEDDRARAIQEIQYFDRTTKAEIIFPYGHHANLPEESLLVVLPILGQSSNLVAMGGLSDKRIPVEQGEVVFFHPITKAKILFKNNGDIEIDSLEKDINVSMNNGTITASGNVTINVTGDTNLTCENANITVNTLLTVDSPDTDWTGNINLTGDITQDGDLTNNETTSNGIALSTHKHTGSPTAPSGSITPTGVPI